MRSPRFALFSACTCSLLASIGHLLFPGPGAWAQGSLTPPAGTPAPTFKTLQQVEPRTDLAALDGDGLGVKVIKAIGSYYLSSDLAGTAGKDTIRVVTAGRVTIDLNGFALTNTGADRSAIALPTANDVVVIRNGIIIAANNSTATRAISGGNRVVCEDLAILGNSNVELVALGAECAVRRCRITGGGVTLGDRSSLSDSVVASTSDSSIKLGDDGHASGVKFTTGRAEFSLGDRGQMSDCQINAAGAPTLFGLSGNVVQTGSGAIVRRCTIDAGNVAGNAIGVGANSLVEGCRVERAFREGIKSNLQGSVTVLGCSVTSNGRRGIDLGENALVRDCSVLGSGLDGILVGVNSSVSGCSVSGAGGIGISAPTGDNVAVSRCTVRGVTGGPGISIFSGSITDCDVTGTTTAAGIQVTQNSRVERNRSAFNTSTEAGVTPGGIKVIGSGNRIEGNHLVNNTGFGLEITSTGSINSNTGNLVIGNNARGNVAGSFSISSGNSFGPAVSRAGMTGNTNPGANYID